MSFVLALRPFSACCTPWVFLKLIATIVAPARGVRVRELKPRKLNHFTRLTDKLGRRLFRPIRISQLSTDYAYALRTPGTKQLADRVARRPKVRAARATSHARHFALFALLYKRRPYRSLFLESRVRDLEALVRRILLCQEERKLKSENLKKRPPPRRATSRRPLKSIASRRSAGGGRGAAQPGPSLSRALKPYTPHPALLIVSL